MIARGLTLIEMTDRRRGHRDPRRLRHSSVQRANDPCARRREARAA